MRLLTLAILCCALFLQHAAAQDNATESPILTREEIKALHELASKGVHDIDGNHYGAKLGDGRIWMAENLRTTRFNNEADIPNITDNEEWGSLETPAYCWYDNDPKHSTLYGALYNGYAVKTGKLCPSGWHVPTKEEWNSLEEDMGSLMYPAQALKVGAEEYWGEPPGFGGKGGFKAMPGGIRLHDGEFDRIGTNGYWWSSSKHPWWPRDLYIRSLKAFSEELHFDLGGGATPEKGLSVRCVRD